MAPQPDLRSPAALIEEEILRLYQEHATALSRYAASFAQNQDGARDAVQEAFLRYVAERRCGRTIDNPRAWLYFVMRNYLLDRHRTVTRREVSAENLDQLPGRHQSPEGMLERSEVAREIEALLTEREFNCLRLRAEGLSYEEIAEMLSIRVGTVGAMLSRVQKKLRRTAESETAAPVGAAEAIRSLVENREVYS
jgi:RNA polymerase sigma-70 factor (ECF subfamily)